MPSDMSFNITALDNASKTFVKMASQVERLTEKLDQLDGKDARIKVDADTEKAQSKLANIGKQAEKTARRSGNRIARALTNPIVLELGALPAAAAAGAAGTAAALGGVTAAFAGIAIAAQKNNKEVQQSFTYLKDHVVSSVRGMTLSVVPYLQQVSQQLVAGFDAIAPQLEKIFSQVGASLTVVTSGVVDMAKNAMPGLVRAVERSAPVMQGFADLARTVGLATSEFLTIVSEQSVAAGQGLHSLGSIVRTVARAAGELVAQLTQTWAQIGPSVSRVLDQLFQVVTKFTSGALQSFADTWSIVGDVLSGLLSVIKPIAGWLGSAAGYLIGVAAAWKLVAGPVSRVVGLFRKLGGVVDVAQRKVSRFATVSKTQMVGAGTAIAAAATVAFSAWMTKQQAARRHSQQLKSATNTLAQALKKTGGVINDQVNPALTRMLFNVEDGHWKFLGLGDSAQTVAENLRMAGISTQTFVGAVKGGKKQTNLFNQQLIQAYRSGKINWATFTALGGALFDFKGVTKDAKAKQQAMNRALGRGKTAANGLLLTMEQLNNMLYGVENATINYKNNLHQLTEGLKQNGLSFDIDTQAGRDNKSQLIRTSQAAQQHFKKVKKQTGSLDAATAAFKSDKLAAYKNMVQLGLTKEAAHELINKYFQVPGDVNTNIGTPGMDEAQREIDELDDKINGLNNKSISVSVEGKWTSSSVGLGHIPADISGYARGGWVSGPGGPTSDSVPARLSNREFVVNAKSAAKHGALLEAINGGRGSGGPAYAGGGVVRSVDVDTSAAVSGIMRGVHKWMQTGISNMAKAWAEYASSMGGAGQWGAVIHKALGILGLPQSWAGITAKQIQIESGGNPRAINLWDCLPLYSMILTRRGWLKHDEVRIGDETIGYNPDTGLSEWTRVTHVGYFQDADLVRLGNSRWNVEATPNHRWVTSRRGRSGTELLSPSQFDTRTSIELAMDADTGQGMPISEAEAELLGWIAADGHVEEGRRGGSISISIGDTKRALLERLLKDFEFSYYSYTSGQHVYRLRPSYSRDLQARAGHPKSDAFELVLSMSREQRHRWAYGVMADAHHDGGHTLVYQCDGPVAEAIHLAGYLNGHRVSVGELTGKDQWSHCNVFGLCKPNITNGPAFQVEQVESGDVWCVTTELGTWTAKQGEHVFLTGNSNAAKGQASRGLLQTIPSTFAAYNIPGLGGIYNPLANVVAAMRYTMARYGSLPAIWPTRGGYANGTGYASRGWHMVGEDGPELVRFNGGEQVVPNHALTPNIDVRVFVGNEEITDHIDTRIEVHERESSQKLRAGRR